MGRNECPRLRPGGRLAAKSGRERNDKRGFMDLIIIAAIMMVGILALFAVTGALLAGLAGLAAVLWFIARNQGERI
jgi:hypothetical protein